MIIAALAAAAFQPSQFSVRMNQYLACLSAGLPADLSERDLQTRSRVYRAAAARCRRERHEAIEAAAREHRPEITEDQARAEAIDIIDTLDPMSSCKVSGAQC